MAQDRSVSSSRLAWVLMVALIVGCRTADSADKDQSTAATKPSGRKAQLASRSFQAKCASYDPVNDNFDNEVTIRIVLQNKVYVILMGPDDDSDDSCVKLSLKGKLVFDIRGLPNEHSLVIDFETRSQDGKLRKGPFKRKNGDVDNPATGRYEFKKDKKKTINNYASGVGLLDFNYTVTLLDANTDVLAEIDPGVMVVPDVLNP